MISKIVTHPGGAHKDDFLGVSLLVARFGVPVERRIPTADELLDRSVAIVDVGGSHEPALMNFDHHHFPREHAPTCALSLVLDHFGLYKDARLFCDWLEPAEWFDSRGPKKTAEWLGVSRDAVARLNSPLDVTLLRRFAAKTELSAGDPLYEVMRFVGADLFDFLKSVRGRIEFVASRVEHWDLESGGDRIQAVFLPRSDEGSDEPSAALARYVRAEGLEESVAALVYPDRRGSGYGIARFNDHPKLDFCRIGEEPDVHFAHVSGFMCKTSATAPERLKALLSNAWG